VGGQDAGGSGRGALAGDRAIHDRRRDDAHSTTCRRERSGRRVPPVETTLWHVRALLQGYVLEEDSDIHLLLLDPQTRAPMIAEIPASYCAPKVYAARFDAARQAVQNLGHHAARLHRIWWLDYHGAAMPLVDVWGLRILGLRTRAARRGAERRRVASRHAHRAGDVETRRRLTYGTYTPIAFAPVSTNQRLPSGERQSAGLTVGRSDRDLSERAAGRDLAEFVSGVSVNQRLPWDRGRSSRVGCLRRHDVLGDSLRPA